MGWDGGGFIKSRYINIKNNSLELNFAFSLKVTFYKYLE